MDHAQPIQDYPEDSYGRRIYVGALVAYNRSGDVKRGIIHEIKCPVKRGHSGTFDRWTGKPFAQVKVRGTDGNISVVNNLNGLMLI